MSTKLIITEILEILEDLMNKTLFSYVREENRRSEHLLSKFSIICIYYVLHPFPHYLFIMYYLFIFFYENYRSFTFEFFTKLYNKTNNVID